MLQLKNIVKHYATGGTKVEALKGVSITFRDSEFVSILGQSGCGKTTLLNIIGGLDGYTSGDLVINGRSTKEYRDRDWDSYRNHSIGFVFQSYNLIPHQTVLANVELALTLSGVSKTERRKRATEALKKVGLGDQLKKKPNQMSGGQMQRVAIARALVNDPEILLADEPTGALDSETSVQIMEILKEIAKDRLIIMVTHNPDLAEKYSTRIIRLLDGKVTDDSRPYNPEEERKLDAARDLNKTKKTSMSFFTALSLSLNNLMTKKGRTFMTAFAGSIGIIGIALILSLSSGFQAYINKVQEDTLSNYPIELQNETVDYSALLGTIAGDQEERDLEESTTEDEENVVRAIEVMTKMYNSMVAQTQRNNLEAFKKYIEDDANGMNELMTAVKYTYDVNMKIYGTDIKGETIRVNPSSVMDTIGMGAYSGMAGSFSSMGMMGSSSNFDVFEELIDNPSLLDSQYEVVAGHWPKDKTELVLVVTKHNRIMDSALYTLGLKDQSTLKNVMLGKEVELGDKRSYTYDELLNLRYKLVFDTDYYKYNEKTGSWDNMSEDEAYMDDVLANALELKVVGIIRPREDAAATSITGTVGYLKELTEYVISETNNNELVKKQKENPDVDVFSGKPFSDSAAAEEVTFDMSQLPQEQQMYLASLSEEQLNALIARYKANAVSTATYEGNLSLLGVADLSVPASISIYPKDFDSKDKLADKISEYNKSVEEENQIRYTDFIGIMMSSVSTIINAITYVLISFVAISLVVSSIMIGIITYISVLERTKEIGILRSIGASKRDVSRVFTAETLIEGLASGLLGVLVTVLLNIPVNMIIKHFAGISNVSALPLQGGIILVLISMALTLLAGFFPSKAAAKKDPVEALRTE